MHFIAVTRVTTLQIRSELEFSLSEIRKIKQVICEILRKRGAYVYFLQVPPSLTNLAVLNEKLKAEQQNEILAVEHVTQCNNYKLLFASHATLAHTRRGESNFLPHTPLPSELCTHLCLSDKFLNSYLVQSYLCTCENGHTTI